MPVERPYIRRIWITIEPPKDPATGLMMKGQRYEFFSDGSRDTIRISFKVHKSIIYIPTPSEIVFYNLNPETRNELAKPILNKDKILYKQITIKVGWQNFTPYEIFKGEVMNSFSQRRGPDILTSVIALSGLSNTMTTTISKTFGETSTLGDVINWLASEMKIKISRISESVLKEKIGFKGISLTGLAKDWLFKLANEYGFSYSILDNKLQILADKENFGRNYPAYAPQISAKTGTLFGLMPLLTSPMQIQTGVEINALLVPNVLPGDLIPVESSVNPQGERWFMVHNITYAGDTGSSEWSMTIQSMKYFGNE